MEVVLLVVRGCHVVAGEVLLLLLLFLVLLAFTIQTDLLQSFVATGGLSLVGFLKC